MYKQWAVNSFLDQASERTNWHISTLIPPPTRGEFLGGWAAAWGAKEVVWIDPAGTGNRREISAEDAAKRLLRLHSSIFEEKRRTLLTLHVHLPTDDPLGLFVNEDLAYRKTSLPKFRSSYPSDWPISSGVEQHLPITPLDAGSLGEVIETAHDVRRAQHFVTAVEASPSLLCQLGLQSQGHDRQGRKLTRFGSGDAPHLYNGLSTLLHEDGATLVVTVASVSEKCERWWVFEDKTKALSEAARLALSDAKLGANDAPAATFSQLHTTWQAVRQEMKPVLEELIQSLSKRTFETFEEKAEVAARLNELLDEWRFRAVSPSSGRAAYFFARWAKRSPNGIFVFKDIDPEALPVTNPDPTAPRAPGQIPVFQLTDMPLDLRRRHPDRKPTQGRRPKKPAQ